MYGLMNLGTLAGLMYTVLNQMSRGSVKNKIK